MDNLVNILNVLFLVLIFLLGGVNKIINFENTTKFLEEKVNSIRLDFIFLSFQSFPGPWASDGQTDRQTNKQTD